MNASKDESPHIVVWDLETRKLAKDLPEGWADLKAGKGGISVLCIYDNFSGRVHFYDEATLELAAQHLESAHAVCSFNGEDFDLPVLQGVLGRRVLIPTSLDLLQLVWASIVGRRKGNKLDEIANRTLGVNKIGNGILAPRLADTGRWAELFEYCSHDVYLTRDLFIFAQQHGGVVGIDGEIIQLQLPDWFNKVKF
jgi:DEAD/DEAH box helicase domain-containing protein